MIGGQISSNETLSVMLATIGDYIKRYNEFFDFINKKITESGLSRRYKGVFIPSYNASILLFISFYR